MVCAVMHEYTEDEGKLMVSNRIRKGEIRSVVG